MRSIALTLIALPALTLAVPAQQKKVIPSAAATQDGSTSTPYFSGYGAGIAQQIIDAAAVARGVGIINELALRAGSFNSMAARFPFPPAPASAASPRKCPPTRSH